MAEKSRISFLLTRPNGPAPAPPAIVPLVDGSALTDLIDTFETQRAYKPVGGYGGLTPQTFDYGPLNQYYLGQLADHSFWTSINGIYLLGCDCGDVGCWPLQCRVGVSDSEVVWTDFSQPHRPERDYSDFGPFSFDAGQYREAVALLVSDLAAEGSLG